MLTDPSSKDCDPSLRGCVDIFSINMLALHEFVLLECSRNMIMLVFAIDILSLLSANMTLIRASFLARRDNATLPWTSQGHCRSPSSTGQSGTDVSSAGRTAASPPPM